MLEAGLCREKIMKPHNKRLLIAGLLALLALQIRLLALSKTLE